MRTRRILGEISETLTRMERDSKATVGAIQNLRQVGREILFELQEHRPILERIDHGVQANSAGLLHVLDELRGGRGGPGAAPAA